MLRKAAEGLHHTPEQVSEALAEALRICEEHDIAAPDHDQLVAALMAHLLSKQVVFEQVSPAGIKLGGAGGGGFGGR